MDISAIKNLTPRECQRRIFIDSLYQELEKASSKVDSKNSSMLKRANELVFVDRLPKDACVDMLIMEGYNDKAARSCIEAYAITDKESEAPVEKYDYCFEDHRGRTFTGRELGDVIEASCEDDARKIIAQTLSEFDPPVNLISVHKIG